ncbi:MAG: hypothetical protein ACYS5V_15090, partial [Planctomycetota bacterium]
DRPPVWPSVIGVLTIVMAVYALARATGQSTWAAWQFIRAAFQGSSSPTPRFPPLEIARQALHVGGNLLAILAGVLLLRRHRATAVLHPVYGVMAILAAALRVSTYCTTAYPAIARSDPYWAGVLLFSAGSNALIGVAYPIFAFVWFCRASVRRRVRSWRTVAGRARAKPDGPVWPSVLGVLSMVMGATALLYSVVELVIVVLQIRRASADEEAWDMAWSVVWAAAALVPVLLVISGWLLVRRRRRAMVCALGYAILACLFVVAMTAFPVFRCLQLYSQRGQGPMTAGDVSVLIGTWVLRGVLSLVFPIFLIAWFARPTVRAQIAPWRVEKAPSIAPGDQAGGAETSAQAARDARPS